ncbi:DUF4231 domain-containing protein [Isoptericola sp. b408]|uniref:DUF4231 domain-containing protein n=1 Tax=Isoptericola sp. b408 TaxID=3064653 RepID=UPI0027131932|nr:DUF4231 domain-containing protein [Isoptericola sp. b408]MDO8152360.1 hypothetical protein [Isoptericola sp. b408]
METSPAGLAVIALFVLWLGYWVPLQLRRRTELAAARVDDRFSGGLRMLTVADGAGKGRVMPTNRAAGHGPTTGSTPRVSAHTSGPASGMTPQVRASRLAVLERRAARARRRLALSVVLALVTAAGWTLVALGSVPWPVAAVPSVLLAVVLVLGRLAVMTSRRSDTRWRAERRAEQQRATQRRTLAHGGPYAPRNRARVTGYAVHPSDTNTQMIPRVQPPPSATSARDRRETVAPSSDRPAEPAEEDEPRSSPQAPTSDDVSERSAGERPGSPDGTDGTAWRVGGAPWDPVPVPLPTYVTKPEAPPRGSTTAGLLASLAGSTHGEGGPVRSERWTVEDRAGRRSTADGPAATTPEPSAGDDPRPRSETLGLPLDQILARRRAAG